MWSTLGPLAEVSTQFDPFQMKRGPGTLLVPP
jgi:hypothetical protein